MAGFSKDPAAVLDYGFDWSAWLAAGETITASSWTVPSGLTKDSDSKSSTATTAWLSSGADGTDYQVVNHIETSDGRKDSRSMMIRVVNR